jgi:hypothetical protein
MGSREKCLSAPPFIFRRLTGWSSRHAPFECQLGTGAARRPLTEPAQSLLTGPIANPYNPAGRLSLRGRCAVGEAPGCSVSLQP